MDTHFIIHPGLSFTLEMITIIEILMRCVLRIIVDTFYQESNIFKNDERMIVELFHDTERQVKYQNCL